MSDVLIDTDVMIDHLHGRSSFDLMRYEPAYSIITRAELFAAESAREDAIRDFGLNPTRVAYIGDRWRDVAAARTLGGRGIMIASLMTTDDRGEELVVPRVRNIACQKSPPSG